MSGHSRWAQIKHHKAGADAKKGALFSKLARSISVAARDGGTNPETNAKLRQAIEYARGAGLPKDNVERAIARAESALDVAGLKSVEYEAYGPGGVALLMSGLTDNSNRTTNEIKKILSGHNGRLAETGSVSWMFDTKMLIPFPMNERTAEELELALIDAGAEETERADDTMHVLIEPERLNAFLETTRSRGLESSPASLIKIPKSAAELDPARMQEISRLGEELEGHPDIHEVWTNAKERGL